MRALARRVNIHRNTVSKAYAELVRRDWLKHKKGSRLSVAPAVYLRGRASHDRLDELIDQSTERAREMGYSLATVRARVAQRLALQTPDHMLVVEPEPDLRKIIQKELHDTLAMRVEGCSPKAFLAGKEVAGTQVAVPEYVFPLLGSVASNDCPGPVGHNSVCQLSARPPCRASRSHGCPPLPVAANLCAVGPRAPGTTGRRRLLEMRSTRQVHEKNHRVNETNCGR